MEFKVNERYTSGETLTAPSGNVDVWIKVLSAPWISLDEIRIIINGERKRVIPVKSHQGSLVKFVDYISLNLKKNSYIALEILGRKSLYPVLQRKSKDGLLEKGPLPYALTNPVFVDVDGNGKFDPPLPGKIKFIPPDY